MQSFFFSFSFFSPPPLSCSCPAVGALQPLRQWWQLPVVPPPRSAAPKGLRAACRAKPSAPLSWPPPGTVVAAVVGGSGLAWPLPAGKGSRGRRGWRLSTKRRMGRRTFCTICWSTPSGLRKPSCRRVAVWRGCGAGEGNGAERPRRRLGGRREAYRCAVGGQRGTGCCWQRASVVGGGKGQQQG